MLFRSGEYETKSNILITVLTDRLTSLATREKETSFLNLTFQSVVFARNRISENLVIILGFQAKRCIINKNNVFGEVVSGFY